MLSLRVVRRVVALLFMLFIMLVHAKENFYDVD